MKHFSTFLNEEKAKQNKTTRTNSDFTKSV